MEKSTSNLIVEQALYKFPQVIRDTNNADLIELANKYLPYSIGIEIECNDLKRFNIKDFTSIPNIMAVDCDETEKRFRIPKGLDGLICLHEICDKLIDNCSLNYGSGIHYHVDLYDVFKAITDTFIKRNNDWIINELVKWRTALKRDSSAICSRGRAWLRYADEHDTIEIRIGEMTFDYGIIVGRIFSCCDIASKIRENLNITEQKKIAIENQELIKKLKQLDEVKEEVLNLNVIKSRMK